MHFLLHGKSILSMVVDIILTLDSVFEVEAASDENAARRY